MQRGQPSRGSQAVIGSALTLSTPKRWSQRSPNTQPQATISKQVSSPPGCLQAKITEMFFCSSIRDRPAWSPVVSLLQAAQSSPRWVKTRLSSHDLAVRILSTSSEKDEARSEVVRFVLVAPADVDKPDTRKKLQRLCQRKDGLGGVVLFLISSGKGEGNNMASYNKFQLSLRGTNLSTLPLTAIATLPATVAAFCSQLTMPPRCDEKASHKAAAIGFIRLYLGDPAPISLGCAKRLIAAMMKAHHPSAASFTLWDVVRFCVDLQKNPPRLAEILGPEDASRLAEL